MCHAHVDKRVSYDVRLFLNQCQLEAIAWFMGMGHGLLLG